MGLTKGRRHDFSAPLFFAGDLDLARHAMNLPLIYFPLQGNARFQPPLVNLLGLQKFLLDEKHERVRSLSPSHSLFPVRLINFHELSILKLIACYLHITFPFKNTIASKARLYEKIF